MHRTDFMRNWARGNRSAIPVPRFLRGVPQVPDSVRDFIVQQGDDDLPLHLREAADAAIREATDEIKRRHEAGKLGVGPYADLVARREAELAADRRDVVRRLLDEEEDAA